jgi:hypothetical protein
MAQVVSHLPRKAVPCSIDRHLCQDPACPVHGSNMTGRKPPGSVRERADFCSSFLAERGCLAPDKPREDVAA